MDNEGGAPHLSVMDVAQSNRPILGRPQDWRAPPGAAGILGALLLVGAVLVAGHALQNVLPRASLSLIFLVAVLLSAITSGFWTGFIAALLAFFGYNFFFVEPLHTFSVARPEDAVALAVFLIVAAITGLLAGGVRGEANAAHERADALELLSAYSAELSAANSDAAIEAALLRHLSTASRGPVVELKDDGAQLKLVAASPPGQTIDPADLLAADWVSRRSQAWPATANGWSGSSFSFHPLKRGASVVAVYGVVDNNEDGEGAQIVETMLRQGEIALERVAFARDAEDARAMAEQERIRSALISSISHDLRTPLATILGSVTSLRELGEAMPAEARADLLVAIEEETGRLARFVSNLLAMTRLEAGLDIKGEWIDAGDVAGAAVKRARQSFPASQIVLEAGPEALLLFADADLLEQALFNLIDNAVKFSPREAPIRVVVSMGPDIIEFDVTDEGPGVPAQDLDNIFEKFYRVGRSGISGAGLGLAICRGVVTALGGEIRAESPVANGRGARMRMTLPRKDAP
jgi:two-component system sensor histidine kinase KdpD